MQADPKLAKVPRKYFAACIKCGIAPAMKVEGEKTFWGRELAEGESEEVKRMLGVDMQLHKPGKDAKEIDRREEALDIIDDPEKGGGSMLDKLC